MAYASVPSALCSSATWLQRLESGHPREVARNSIVESLELFRCLHRYRKPDMRDSRTIEGCLPVIAQRHSASQRVRTALDVEHDRPSTFLVVAPVGWIYFVRQVVVMRDSFSLQGSQRCAALSRQLPAAARHPVVEHLQVSRAPP